jgi:hypothetical protein
MDMPYDLKFVIDIPYDLKFAIDMSYDRNEYPNTSCLDAPIPPYFSILRCDHHKRLTSNNQDIRAQSLVLTIVALIRV